MTSRTVDPLEVAFRDAMATVCTPVAVITSLDGERPHGTTVSAFMSLSMTPPMILIALDNRSDLLELVRSTGLFAVNVLNSRQGSLAMSFAKKGRDKFDGVEWSRIQELPRIRGCPVWIACTAEAFVPGGDHTIVTGSVALVETLDKSPLTYHNRVFGTHATS
ncbi:flavin reductase family protein [Rhodococcus wratislaviensis]|uniref:Putative oxidoreductase n=1 Tax=Rhodococcus wratislaviensis NBRC 100605 TaxID=1219028 RepID=X0PXQ7_RHOWR|nr:flavin reductase family protein [Rhodococcus wratislaviensis]GAF43142.1 putative oxidoreductase [Rhodococcus wratislaviensis NBRC 100605]